MSATPDDLDRFCDRFAQESGLPRSDMGSAADETHLAGGGYHCGAFDLRRIGKQKTDYSATHARDQARIQYDLAHGINFSCAVDAGDDWPRGGRAAWLRFNNNVVFELINRPEVLPALRGENFSPDGTLKRRYDTANPGRGVYPSTDTVAWHTHLEFWRDTLGVRQATLDRIIAHVQAARDNAPLSNYLVTLAPPQSTIAEADVIFTATGVPTGATDVNGVVVPENGQCLATPNGPFNLTGNEFFSLPASAQPVRITMSWTRLLSLCAALKVQAQANLTDAQFADFKREAVPIVHDAAQTGGNDGANAGVVTALDGATIHVTASTS